MPAHLPDTRQLSRATNTILLADKEVKLWNMTMMSIQGTVIIETLHQPFHLALKQYRK